MADILQYALAQHYHCTTMYTTGPTKLQDLAKSALRKCENLEQFLYQMVSK